MRDVNRIKPVVNALGAIWATDFPDFRFGQLMMIFENWVSVNKECSDIFYIEDDKILEYFEEFAEAVGVHH
jgi:hypothetical protein